MAIAPDQVLDTEDPGDDVAARFHYQHCFAAIHTLKMIGPQANVAEVICENHEDFLVRYSDGSVVAVQIKTRDLTQPPFKAKDDQVIKALARFAKLETRFPGSIKCFEFLTNHGFWVDEDTDNNLPYMLRQLHERKSVKGLKKTSPLRAWVARISGESELTEDEVVAALIKCIHTARNDTVESARKDVIDAVSECGYGHVSYAKIRGTARALVELARSASTKSKGTSVLALYEAGSNLSAILAHQQLAAKRIVKHQIEELISASIQAGFETLCIDDDANFNDMPPSLAIMFQKLGKGELEIDRVHQLENLVHSFEALYFKWAAREGAEEARKKINDLKSIVQFDCTEAKVAAQKTGAPYAAEMYVKLYERLKQRCDQDSSKVYGCRPEHLLGTAGVLTQECTVWWSDKFDVTAKDGT